MVSLLEKAQLWKLMPRQYTCVASTEDDDNDDDDDDDDTSTQELSFPCFLLASDKSKMNEKYQRT